MPPDARQTPPTRRAGRLIGYARVSTEAQSTDPQADELRAACCRRSVPVKRSLWCGSTGWRVRSAICWR